MTILCFVALAVLVSLCCAQCTDCATAAAGTVKWCDCCSFDCDQRRAACMTEGFCSFRCRDATFCKQLLGITDPPATSTSTAATVAMTTSASATASPPTTDTTTSPCGVGCMNGGVCVNGACDCGETGWTDRFCHKPVCKSACVRGFCSAPDKCTCDVGFSGPQCQTFVSRLPMAPTASTTAVTKGAPPPPQLIDLETGQDTTQKFTVQGVRFEFPASVAASGSKQVAVAVADSGSELGATDAFRHFSQVASIGLRPASKLAEPFLVCMQTAVLPDGEGLCLATFVESSAQWNCTQTNVFAEQGERCGRVFELPEDGSQQVFGFLVPSQVTQTRGSPTTQPLTTTTTVTTAPTTSKNLRDIVEDLDSQIVGTWEDFVGLGTTFMIVVGASIGVCLLCCCIAFWLRGGGSKRRRDDDDADTERGSRGRRINDDSEFKSFAVVEKRQVGRTQQPRRNPTPPDSSTSSVEFENVELVDVVHPSHIATVTERPKRKSSSRRHTSSIRKKRTGSSRGHKSGGSRVHRGSRVKKKPAAPVYSEESSSSLQEVEVKMVYDE